MKTIYKTDIIYLPENIVELITSQTKDKPLQTQKEWNDLITKIVREYFSNTQDH